MGKPALGKEAGDAPGLGGSCTGRATARFEPGLQAKRPRKASNTKLLQRQGLGPLGYQQGSLEDHRSGLSRSCGSRLQGGRG